LESNKLWKENHRLAVELGRVATGQGLYKWIWSEDPELQHPMRTPEQYDFKSQPNGLIVAEPVYTLRKMCLTADHQWVLCHWIDSPSESEWRRLFGYSLEWPRVGQYYPTSVQLDPGIEPCIQLTQTVINEVRMHRNVSGAEVARRGEAFLDKKEAKRKANLYDRIRNDLPTYDHIEGTKDSVSYPSVGAKEEHANRYTE
jgi:hypothetical protein